MKISIPSPCNENWNQMTTSEKGRFCPSCQTQVVNFKGMAPEEIKQFLELQTGSICCRSSTHQLEVFNAAYQELISPSNLKKWTMVAIFAGISVLPSFAQDSPSTIPIPLANTSISYYHYQPQVAKITEVVPTGDTVVLMGHIIDFKSGETLPFANVVVRGTQIGTVTDIDGKFLLKVPKSKEAISLVVYYVGYPTLFHAVVPNSTKANLVLKMDATTIMDVMIGKIVINRKVQKVNNRAYKKELRKEEKIERALKKA